VHSDELISLGAAVLRKKSTPCYQQTASHCRSTSPTRSRAINIIMSNREWPTFYYTVIRHISLVRRCHIAGWLNPECKSN